MYRASWSTTGTKLGRSKRCTCEASVCTLVCAVKNIPEWIVLECPLDHRLKVPIAFAANEHRYHLIGAVPRAGRSDDSRRIYRACVLSTGTRKRPGMPMGIQRTSYCRRHLSHCPLGHRQKIQIALVNYGHSYHTR